MKGHSPHGKWVLILLILAGVVIGGFIGDYLSGFDALSFLKYGKTFGLNPPLTLDLGVLTLQFGLSVRFTIAGILGIFLAVFLYKKI